LLNYFNTILNQFNKGIICVYRKVYPGLIFSNSKSTMKVMGCNELEIRCIKYIWVDYCWYLGLHH